MDNNLFVFSKTYKEITTMAESRSTVITLLCFVLVFILNLCDFAHGLDLSCIEVKKEYVKMGFRDDSSVPISPVSGDHLQICPHGTTCCTPDMESKFKSLSMKEYESVADEAFRFIKSTFVSRTKKFDEFFTELLENSKRDLHEMFVRTYGLLYQQNAEVFSNLFRDLKLYYKGNNLNLVDILNDFFTNLLQRMFKLINAQYLFDGDYLTCVTRHMDDLKPFGDVPQKLKLQVKRAFIAARTFVQGLAIGRDVVLAMERIQPTEACTRGITRMKFCPHCRGLTRTKPCNNFCLNTMKGCLAHHSELNKAWNEYIEALKMVAQRLEGPFNIETVVDPIDVKISEAIMNFQEDSTTVTDKIFKGCGEPRREQRNKRQSTYEDYAYGKEFLTYARGEESAEGPTTAAGTNLNKLVKDIKAKVEQAKNFWVQLPYTICNSEIAAQPGEDDNCWNGQDRARYVHEVQKDGRIYQVNNPEVTVDVQEDNGIISVQIHNLKLITTKLHNAYHGVDVEWAVPNLEFDGSGDDLEGSGDRQKGDRVVGSGDGAGGDDEDRRGGNDEVYSGSGSGDGPEEDPSVNKQPPVQQTPKYHNTRRPDDDMSFSNPPNVKYDVHRPPKKDNNVGGSACTLSSSALMIVSTIYIVLRIVV